jgi:hypothetical protein
MSGSFAKYLSVFLLSGIVACSGSSKNESVIIITNPGDKAIADELIVFTRADVEVVAKNKNGGALAKNDYVLLTDTKGQPVLVQYDDVDGDGSWDEMAILANIDPKGQLEWVASIAKSPATIKAKVRAHVRQKRKNADGSFGDDLAKDSVPVNQPATNFSKQALPPFLTEGPAWENDKVGFRLYFDVRNGKDIWGKLVPQMVLDEVGADTAKNYHKIADWGMDVLKVGKSLGAGSLALSVGTVNGRDSLIRLGGTNMGPITYEKISDGPLRAVFRLHYPSWKIPGYDQPVQLTEEISIWGGIYGYESKVTIKNAPANSKLVVGIVNLYSKESHTMDSDGAKVLYTYDAQTENKDSLGMAVMVSADQFSSFITTPNTGTDILNTYAVSVIPKNGNLVYRFYAGWEKSDAQFKSGKGFAEYLKKEAGSFQQILPRKLGVRSQLSL